MENENEIPENEGTPKKLTYEELEAELKNVRSESASRRIELRDLKAKADRWDEYEESQKTELQRLQDALKERDEKLSNYALAEMKQSIAKELGLESGDEDLLVGSDEASLRAHGAKLKERLGSKKEETPRPVDLLAGNRGTPIGSSDSFNVDDMIRRLAKS